MVTKNRARGKAEERNVLANAAREKKSKGARPWCVLLVRGVVLPTKHPRVHERDALVVFLARTVCRQVDVVVGVLVVDDFSCELDVIVCCR